MSQLNMLLLVFLVTSLCTRSYLSKQFLVENKNGKHFLVKKKETRVANDYTNLLKNHSEHANKIDFKKRDHLQTYDEYNIKDKRDDAKLLRSLKKTLGVQKKRGRSRFRSSRNRKKEEEENKKTKSLVINSLLQSDNLESQPIKTCPPKSLGEWKNNQSKEENMEDIKLSNCDVVIPEIGHSKKSSSNSWDKYNNMLKNDSDVLSVFPKGDRPANLDPLFRKVANYFANTYLIHEKSYHKLLAKIAFFKEHDDVNEVLLDQAVTITLLKRDDLSKDIQNPAEYVDIYFPTNITEKVEPEPGSDYSLFINMKKDHDLIKDGHVSLSDDPVEAKLDYWREDSLFHAFHTLLHKTWGVLAEEKPSKRFPRTFELFFYAHQQMVRRYAVERFLSGIPSVVKLTPDEFEKSLGPAYRKGWYGWSTLGDRVGDCNLGEVNKTAVEGIRSRYNRVKSEIGRKPKPSYEEFCHFVEKKYHATGHLVISKDCSSKFEAPRRGKGPMAHSEVSARDPVFYRWHGHLEDLIQQFRDTHLPLYRKTDFQVSDDVEIIGVNTVIEKETAETAEDIRNTLITFWETAQIRYASRSTIFYKRVNHLEFKYELNIKNPKEVVKKVMFRIWLGILADESNVNSFYPEYMLEMDQFVHTLSGSSQEVVERYSTETVATMKEQDGTLWRLMKDIKGGGRRKKKNTATWCGIPQNLLIPRSQEFDPDKEDMGGKNFILFAIMTDVENDVVLGTDGVEHLLCGHREIKTKLDGKPFGFPFDRKLGFRLIETYNFIAFSSIKILYRSEKYEQKAVAEKIIENSRKITITSQPPPTISTLSLEIEPQQQQPFQQESAPKQKQQQENLQQIQEQQNQNQPQSNQEQFEEVGKIPDQDQTKDETISTQSLEIQSQQQQQPSQQETTQLQNQQQQQQLQEQQNQPSSQEQFEGQNQTQDKEQNQDEVKNQDQKQHYKEEDQEQEQGKEQNQGQNQHYVEKDNGQNQHKKQHYQEQEQDKGQNQDQKQHHQEKDKEEGQYEAQEQHYQEQNQDQKQHYQEQDTGPNQGQKQHYQEQERDEGQNQDQKQHYQE